MSLYVYDYTFCVELLVAYFCLVLIEEQHTVLIDFIFTYFKMLVDLSPCLHCLNGLLTWVKVAVAVLTGPYLDVCCVLAMMSTWFMDSLSLQDTV